MTGIVTVAQDPRGMGRSATGKVSAVEAAYARVEDENAWLTQLLRAVAPDIAEGMGAFAYVYEAAHAPLRIGTCSDVALECDRDLLLDAVRGVDDEYIGRTWRRLSFGLGSEIVPFVNLPAAAPLVRAGIRDMLAINAYDPSGVGVWLGAPLPNERKARPGEAQTWTRIAAHIAAAFRLRRRGGVVASSANDAAAVLSPDGKLRHATGPASTDRTRTKLREAVVRMERARGPLRDRKPDDAVGLWRTLVDGELTLLDAFERDGRRYIVAVENATAGTGPDALAHRERQVVALAGGGRTTKVIAYELGLSDSTVRVLLARATRKLGVTTRAELVAVYLAHAAKRTVPQ